MYSIILTVILTQSSNFSATEAPAAAVSTVQVGNYLTVQTCEAVAKQLRSTSSIGSYPRTNITKDAHCIQVKDK